MSIASKYNKGSVFTYQAPDNTPFISLEELYNGSGNGTVFPLRSLYINSKGMYGDAPVAITDDYFVNLPKHMLDTVQAMLSDGEFIQAVNNGNVGFRSGPIQ